MSRYPREAQQAEAVLREIQGRNEGNRYCADCGAPRPDFINTTIGTFICSQCADIHRTTSNRRIKDMYSRDITPEDCRRMEAVGNDVANRRFLATWNPRDFPEPDNRDREAVREFIWLKYEGSFKKQPPSLGPSSSRDSRDSREYRSNERYYEDRERERERDRDRERDRERERDRDRDRPAFRREQELFRDTPPAPDRPRSFWSSRMEQNPPQALSAPASRSRDDYYRRGPSPSPPLPDRFRGTAAPDRFRPPEPTPVVPYGRAIRNARARYQEQGPGYEEYGSANSQDREELRTRLGSSRSRSRNNSQSTEVYAFSDDDVYDERVYRRSREGRAKSKSRKKRSDDSDENEDQYEEEEVVPRRSKKSTSKKTKKKSEKVKKRVEEELEDEYDDTEEEDEEEDRKRSKRKASKKPLRDSEKSLDSLVSGGANGAEGLSETRETRGQASKAEFDLMSEWMGDSKDTETSQVTNPDAPAQQAAAVPNTMHQAYATQMPMMPPMSVYGGMMPMPGGGFMPLMPPPGFVPTMGVPGMPGMTPGMVMPGMAGLPGMPGLVNGMQGLNVQQTGQQGGQNAPPPPPVGMPAGPPPGPPPEPP